MFLIKQGYFYICNGLLAWHEEVCTTTATPSLLLSLLGIGFWQFVLCVLFPAVHREGRVELLPTAPRGIQGRQADRSHQMVLPGSVPTLLCSGFTGLSTWGTTWIYTSIGVFNLSDGFNTYLFCSATLVQVCKSVRWLTKYLGGAFSVSGTC